MVWAALIPVLGTVIEKIFPDANAAADAKLKVMELAQNGELAALNAEMQLAMGQIDTNKIEAAQPGLFKGGWRPATGWVCVFGLGYEFIVRLMLPFTLKVFGVDNVPELPSLDMEAMMGLLTGLLGLGGLRTYERIKNKA